MNLESKIDTKPLQKEIQKAAAELHQEAKESLLKSASVFASAAQKFTPPFNYGASSSASIPKKFYYRQVKSLKEIAKLREGNTQDYEMLRKGFLYKIFRTSEGSLNVPRNYNKAYAYARTAQEAKRLARIETRGLMRAMWGKNLYEIDAKVPTTIKNILMKSPKLEGMEYNDVSLKDEGDGWTVEITNKSCPPKLGDMIADKAMSITMKELQHRLNALNKKERDF